MYKLKFSFLSEFLNSSFLLNFNQKIKNKYYKKIKINIQSKLMSIIYTVVAKNQDLVLCEFTK